MASLTSMGDDLIARVIMQGINDEIEAEIERQVAEVADRVRLALRQKVGEIAVGLFSRFDMMRSGHNLVITIDTTALEPK